eukprot:SAG31_NODE_30826_length_375_cov_1.297101_1_plen_124_part_11
MVADDDDNALHRISVSNFDVETPKEQLQHLETSLRNEFTERTQELSKQITDMQHTVADVADAVGQLTTMHALNASSSTQSIYSLKRQLESATVSKTAALPNPTSKHLVKNQVALTSQKLPSAAE